MAVALLKQYEMLDIKLENKIKSMIQVSFHLLSMFLQNENEDFFDEVKL